MEELKPEELEELAQELEGESEEEEALSPEQREKQRAIVVRKARSRKEPKIVGRSDILVTLAFGIVWVGLSALGTRGGSRPSPWWPCRVLQR